MGESGVGTWRELRVIIYILDLSLGFGESSVPLFDTCIECFLKEVVNLRFDF